MKFLIIVLSMLLVFNSSADDTKPSSFESAKRHSSTNKVHRVSRPAAMRPRGRRRFTSGKPVIPKVTPVVTSAPTSTGTGVSNIPKVQPRRVGSPVTRGPKIFFDSQSVPDLFINWLDDNGKITDRIKIPKNSRLGVSIPDGINYFEIANDTETLKSGKLRVADKAIYTVTCGRLSNDDMCEKLKVQSSKLIKRTAPKAPIAKTPATKKNIQPDSKISAKTNVISINNNTGKQFQIAWLTKTGKLFYDNKPLTAIQGDKEYAIPSNAAKFQVIWAMSIKSNIMSAVKDNKYEVDCRPWNSRCNTILIKYAGKVKASGKKDASSADSQNTLNIYLTNATKNALRINWLDSNGKALSSSNIAKDKSQQLITIVENAVSFTISTKDGNIPSDSINLVANEVYKISCQPISSSNKTCTQITVEDSGPFGKFKVTRAYANPTQQLAASSATSGSSGFASQGASGGGYGGGGDSSDGDSSGGSSDDAMLPDYSSDGSVPGSGSGSSSDLSGSTDSSDGSGDGSGSGN